MRIKLTILTAIVAMSLFLFGCSIAQKQVSIEMSCDDFYANQHVRNDVQVPVDGTITLTLCSNPSTGFQWEPAQISNPSVLEEVEHKFVGPKEEGGVTPAPGTPGQDVWTFKALKKGTSTVSIYYSRPWEGGEKGEWTFDLTVVVK